MKIDKSKVKKILFISLSNIGDIVLTTPVLRVLSQNFPDARIDIMVGPNGAELFKKHPAIFKVVVYDKHITFLDKQRLIRKLRKTKYDLIADMKNSLFPFLVGSKYRTNPMSMPPKNIRNKKEQHLWKLSSLGAGLDIRDARFYIHVPDEDNDYVERIMLDFDRTRPIIAVSPGTKSEIKKWPKESYAELINRLSHEFGAQIIMVSDKTDTSLIRDIAMYVKHDITDVSGRTTLCQLASLLGRCDLLVTNDSAPMHIAEAMRTKVLAIFGPTDPEAYGPTGANDRIVRKGLPCSPCSKAQCEFKHECMKQLEVNEVFNIAKEMLSLRREKNSSVEQKDYKRQ